MKPNKMIVETKNSFYEKCHILSKASPNLAKSFNQLPFDQTKNKKFKRQVEF